MLHGRHVPMETLKLIVEAYPEALQVPDDGGLLPLHVAAGTLHLPLLSYLVHMCPSTITATTHQGQIPMHFALLRFGRDNVPALRFFLGLWPDAVRHHDSTGNLPLHVATRSCCIESVRHLLAQYPEAVKTQNAEGNIPLHVATSTTFAYDIAYLFLELYPEAVKVRNAHGKLPVHAAAATDRRLTRRLVELRRASFDRQGQDRTLMYAGEAAANRFGCTLPVATYQSLASCFQGPWRPIYPPSALLSQLCFATPRLWLQSNLAYPDGSTLSPTLTSALRTQRSKMRPALLLYSPRRWGRIVTYRAATLRTPLSSQPNQKIHDCSLPCHRSSFVRSWHGVLTPSRFSVGMVKRPMRVGMGDVQFPIPNPLFRVTSMTIA